MTFLIIKISSMTDEEKKEEAKRRAKIIMSLKEGYKQKVTMTAVEYFYRHYILEMEQHGEIHIDLLNKLYERSKQMEKQQCLKMLPYDLDELADEYCNKIPNTLYEQEIFKEGFQKALELLTFKSE
jgi:hypothetical protein